MSQELLMLLIIAGIAVIIALILVFNFRIVRQSTVKVVERMGKYKTVWKDGPHIKLPLFDKVVKTVDLKEQVMDFPPQPVITKDNITMQIDTVVFFQVTDAKLYTYGVRKPIHAMENLTATTLRNIIGELELDDTLTSRDLINNKMRTTLDDATDPWGIKINRVEVKNIMPPKNLIEAMERQMRAEREKREAIIIAQGNKESAVLNAEGNKLAAILNAEAEKETKIRLAEGEAQRIISLGQAKAKGIKLINEAKASKEYIALKALESLEKVADGKATKIIIPSEIQNITSLLAGVSAATSSIKDNNEKK